MPAEASERRQGVGSRVKFVVAGQRPQRFRLVYRQVDERTRAVLAIGLREEHAIYRLAARRIAP